MMTELIRDNSNTHYNKNFKSSNSIKIINNAIPVIFPLFLLYNFIIYLFIMNM